MKKTISTLLVAGMLAIGTCMASLSFASPATKTDATLESSNTPMIARLANKLELTDKQRTDIKTIVQKAEQKAMSLNDSMLKNRTQLGEMLNNNSYDAKKVSSLAKQQGESVTKIIEIQAKMQHDIIQILTPTQRKELKKMIQDTQKRLEDLRAAAVNAQAQHQK